MTLEQPGEPLTLEMIPGIRTIARTHYRPERPLAYHNYDMHVVRTEEQFLDIAKKLETQNVEIDIPVGLTTVNFHDAGYHLPHRELAFNSKEELSASIADKELTKMGIRAEQIQQVNSGIMATQVNVIPVTNTDKAVRIADVGNIFSTEFDFLTNFIALIHEARELHQPLAETFEDQCRRSRDILLSYIVPAPIFIDRDGNEVTYDTTPAEMNLYRLGKVTFDRIINLSSLKKIFPLNWYADNLHR